jgi:hypothetical protein
MKPLPIILALILVSSVPFNSTPTYAQAPDLHQSPDSHIESEEEEDDEPVQRVARLSFIQGDVSFLRAGVTEWADAVENLPLLTGDQLFIGKGSRAELQLGRGNYLRLSENTSLTIADLSHTTAQFEITEGIAIVRLERFGTAFSRFEIDTPNSALVLEQDGLYRVNVRGKDESEMIVRRGSADVATLDASFKVREGQRLLVDTSREGGLHVAADTSSDDWDRWSYERDDTIDNVVVASAPDYVTEQESTSHCFYGAGELARYGAWTHDPSYGYCWIPRVTSGWAPYRVGQWLWIPRVGWSWLSHEPWGWAPYHYGRWAHLPHIGWAWVPGIRSHYRYGHSYYQWRPALVRFYYTRTPRGNYIAWCPLNPGERWRRPDRDRRHNDRRNDNRDGRDRDRSRHASRRSDSNDRPGSRRGFTAVPAYDFAKLDRVKLRPEAPDPEVTRSLAKDATPGLPSVPPGKAAAPRIADNNGKPRYLSTPPPEILTRPVVTRNRPSDSQAESFAPRERRLVSPRKVKASISSEAPIVTKSNGSSEPPRTRSKETATSSDSGHSEDHDARNKGKVKSAKPRLAEIDGEQQKRRRALDQEGASDKSASENGSNDKANGGSENNVPAVKNRARVTDSNPKETEDSGKEERMRQKERIRSERAKSDEGGHENNPRTDENSSKRARHENTGGSDANNQPRSRPNKETESSAPRNEVKEQRRHDAPPPEKPVVRETERQERRQEKQERRKGN